MYCLPFIYCLLSLFVAGIPPAECAGVEQLLIGSEKSSAESAETIPSVRITREEAIQGAVGRF